MDGTVTVKQAEIVGLVMAGLSLADIARRKGVSRQAISKQYRLALKAIEKETPNAFVLDGKERVRGLIDKAIQVHDEAMNSDQAMRHRLQASKCILDGTQVFVRKTEVKDEIDMKEYLELKRQEAIRRLEKPSPEEAEALAKLFGYYDPPAAKKIGDEGQE